MVSLATAALVLGVALVIYYWLLFDTTVAADPDCDRFAVENGLQYGCGRVHNYGLGQLPPKLATGCRATAWISSR